ncbi:MAG: hypothetical protein D6722_12695 [Bacteroidetes bacterium]|nr:MAG: hypothetical protein D6722_12695 [Bacteroidota bacterium]
MLRLMLLLGLIGLAPSLLAQPYRSFPETEATWLYFYYELIDWREESYYELQGDTLIHGETWVKVWQQRHNSYYPPANLDRYEGAFRQDTALRQLWWYGATDSVARLWYDFSRDTGDTLYQLGQPTGLKLGDRDSILLGGQYHRRWQLVPLDSLGFLGVEAYLIEGIGNTAGLITPRPEWFESGESLLCFTRDNQAVYPPFVQGEVCFLTALDRLPVPDWEIGPNPTSGDMYLRTPSPPGTPQAIQVLDPLGRICHQATWPAGQPEIRLQMAHLPPGPYYLRVGIRRSGPALPIWKL